MQGGDVDVGGGLRERRRADLSQGRAPQARLVGLDRDGRVRLARALGDQGGQRRLRVGVRDAVQSAGRGASNGGASHSAASAGNRGPEAVVSARTAASP